MFSHFQLKQLHAEVCKGQYRHINRKRYQSVNRTARVHGGQTRRSCLLPTWAWGTDLVWAATPSLSPRLFWEMPVEPVGCNLARVMHLQFHAGFAAFWGQWQQHVKKKKKKTLNRGALVSRLCCRGRHYSRGPCLTMLHKPSAVPEK